MYEGINGGHEHDCSQLPFDPIVFCMSAVGFLSFRLCELSSHLQKMIHNQLSYQVKVLSEIQHGEPYKNLFNRFQRMQRNTQTRYDRIREAKNDKNALKVTRFFGFFDTLIVHVKGDCSQVRLTSRLNLLPRGRGMSPSASRAASVRFFALSSLDDGGHRRLPYCIEHKRKWANMDELLVLKSENLVVIF